MKKAILLTLLFLAFMANSSAQETNDIQQIEKTLNYYLIGGTNNDFEMLRKAFHENTMMKFVAKGDYREIKALPFFEEEIKSMPNKILDRKTRVKSIQVTGHAASANVEIEYPMFTYVDYMNLLKINGEWKIVSKIFFKKEKK